MPSGESNPHDLTVNGFKSVAEGPTSSAAGMLGVRVNDGADVLTFECGEDSVRVPAIDNLKRLQLSCVFEQVQKHPFEG